MMCSNASLEHEKLFSGVVALVKDYLVRSRMDGGKTTKVIDFKTPKELERLIEFKLGEKGTDDDTLLDLCTKVVKYSVNTSHPHFFNQLFTGADEVGLLASFISTTTNTSMYTFEMAPVYSLMESEVLSKLRELIGWEGGKGDGIFSPGGSMSNIYGLLLARYKKFPESKMQGICDLPQMAILCSENAHYSVSKGSFILGIGTENVIKIKCDESTGKMIPAELERMLQETKSKSVCPIAVVATAATTVLAAFDPLKEIASICEKHSVWLHVDGCFGASVLMSRKHRHLAAGIERADSVSWNPHKSLGVPLQCSAFLTRRKGLLTESNSTQASYLFQRDKLNYDVCYDTGNKSVQCGRLNDTFKLWLMWKQKGRDGFGEVIDHSIQMAKHLANSIRNRGGFQLVIENPEYTNVCFWYFPPKMRELYPLTMPPDPLAASRLTKVAPLIKARMVEQGSVMMTYQSVKHLPNFFRMTLTTPTTTEQDNNWLLEEIESLGSDIDII